MGQTGSTIEKIYRLQIRVGVAVEHLRESGSAQRVGVLQKDLMAEVVAVRDGGDVATILEAERALLRDEYERFANTPLTKASLEAALEEVDAALAMVEMVQDPETYRLRVDETHRVRKRRVGGVPKDDARVFFAGHVTRLADWEKARGTDEDKAVLTARRASIRKAGRIYQGQQREALGIADRGRGGR